jgi:hypothetical protein
MTSRRWFRGLAAAAAATVFAVAGGSAALADQINGDADALATAGPFPNGLTASQQVGTTKAYDFSAVIKNTGNAANDVFPGTVTAQVSASGAWLTAPTPLSVSALTFASYDVNSAGKVSITVPCSGSGVVSVATVTLVASASNGESLNPGSVSLTYRVTGSGSCAPTNSAPDVSVTGVTGGASYEFGSVPAANCTVVDTEDGNSSFAASLSVVTGPLEAHGLGSQAATCSYMDAGGLSDSANVTFSIVDTTDPVITFVSRVEEPNANGWNDDTVVVTWACTDNVDVANATVSDTIANEAANQVATGTCVDVTGRTASATVSPINVDRIDPVITYVGRTPANSNGWNNGDVTVTWSCTDASGSGVEASTVSETVSTEDDNQSTTGTCTDLAGNTASNTQTDINIDKTNPSITYDSRIPAANANGWNNGPVTVTWDCTDTGSGVEDATAEQTVSNEGANQPSTGTCTDLAGNTAEDTQTGINIDTTDPLLDGGTAAPLANANGWNNGPVTVNWGCTDTLSGVAPGSPASRIVSTEGANQSATTTCADLAGNMVSATKTGINIDLTNPAVSLVGGPADGGSYVFGSVPAAPTCTASDTLSGLDGACSVAGYGSTVGSHTVTASAKDKAGNTVSDSRAYSVTAWTLKGFYQPVDMGNVFNTVKNGSTVPFKFEVFAGNTELTSTSVVSTFTATQITCSAAPEDVIEETITDTGATVLRYDSTGGQFIRNWQTPKKAGICYRITMTSQDGSSLSALFKLK